MIHMQNFFESEKAKAVLEGIKEVARWVVLFAVSWVITQTVAQINLVPEFFTLKVWVFSYLIPVRLAFNVGLTMLGRFVDKMLYELGKSKGDENMKKGLTRF